MRRILVDYYLNMLDCVETSTGTLINMHELPYCVTVCGYPSAKLFSLVASRYM